jgi:hypothetical protein
VCEPLALVSLMRTERPGGAHDVKNAVAQNYGRTFVACVVTYSFCCQSYSPLFLPVYYTVFYGFEIEFNARQLPAGVTKRWQFKKLIERGPRVPLLSA